MNLEKQIALELPEQVKILGISGSPRKKGNTSAMVRYCLAQAEKMGYAETEYLSLADCNLYPCVGCRKCFGPDAPDAPYQCYMHPDDDMRTIIPKMVESDGILLGFPVYVAGVPSLFRMFHEKCAVFGSDPIFLPSQLAIEPFDYVALGHLHRHQNLNPKGYPSIVYSGSVERIDLARILIFLRPGRPARLRRHSHALQIPCW